MKYYRLSIILSLYILVGYSSINGEVKAKIEFINEEYCNKAAEKRWNEEGNMYKWTCIPAS